MYIITWDEIMTCQNSVITDTWNMVHIVYAYLKSEYGNTRGVKNIRIIDGTNGIEMDIIKGMS